MQKPEPCHLYQVISRLMASLFEHNAVNCFNASSADLEHADVDKGNIIKKLIIILLINEMVGIHSHSVSEPRCKISEHGLILL